MLFRAVLFTVLSTAAAVVNAADPAINATPSEDAQCVTTCVQKLDSASISSLQSCMSGVSGPDAQLGCVCKAPQATLDTFKSCLSTSCSDVATTFDKQCSAIAGNGGLKPSEVQSCITDCLTELKDAINKDKDLQNCVLQGSTSDVDGILKCVCKDKPIIEKLLGCMKNKCAAAEPDVEKTCASLGVTVHAPGAAMGLSLHREIVALGCAAAAVAFL